MLVKKKEIFGKKEFFERGKGGNYYWDDILFLVFWEKFFLIFFEEITFVWILGSVVNLLEGGGTRFRVLSNWWEIRF